MLKFIQAVFIAAAATQAMAFTLPTQGAGSDGELNPAGNLEIDLSLATTGAWDTTSGTGNGVYDPEQWLVIFRYTSVTIASGRTVTFKNHPSGAPVAWLVQGNVTIAGTLDIRGDNGMAGANSALYAVPGPGGFPGGRGKIGGNASAGFGPGGGGLVIGAEGCDASYATGGVDCAGSRYGDSTIFPLLGGSGGSGNDMSTQSGGAGGGAILIASTGDIVISGQLLANGGTRDGDAGSGSGGAVRLIGDDISGTGIVSAIGGTDAGHGRVRVEGNNITLNSSAPPYTAALPADEPKLFLAPGDGTPTITAVTLSGNAIPADTRPRRAFPADVEVEQEGPQTVALTAENVPSNATVKVRVVPRSGPDALYEATFASTGPGENESQWIAEVTMPEGFSSIQAYAILPE